MQGLSDCRLRRHGLAAAPGVYLRNLVVLDRKAMPV